LRSPQLRAIGLQYEPFELLPGDQLSTSGSDAPAPERKSTAGREHKPINEVETLCRVYVGKNAESEEWGETCRRLAASGQAGQKGAPETGEIN